jgi:hypothetical protein
MSNNVEATQVHKNMENQNTDEISDKQLEFSVFCIENVADKLGLKGNEVYQILAEKSNLLDEYIIANYEVLHTQSKDYIVEDIIDFMKEEGLVE